LRHGGKQSDFGARKSDDLASLISFVKLPFAQRPTQKPHLRQVKASQLLRRKDLLELLVVSFSYLSFSLPESQVDSTYAVAVGFWGELGALLSDAVQLGPQGAPVFLQLRIPRIIHRPEVLGFLGEKLHLLG
jgi:hypothetical protein